MTKWNIIALVLLLASCGQQSPTEPTAQDSFVTISDTVAATPDVQGMDIQSGDFQEIGKTGIVLFPLTISETEEKDGKWSVKSYRSGSIYYWNVLFHNTHIGETHLLSEQKMLIGQIHPPSEVELSDETDSIRRHIFYRIRVDDVDKDGILSEKDPEYLFLSGLDGKGLRQVSPSGLHVRSWGMIKSTHTVIMIVAKDSNKDGVYTQEDEELIYRMDILRDYPASELVSGEMKNKLRKLYESQWKKKSQ